MSTLYIVRGLPGSGKSTYAKKLAQEIGTKHYEGDQYFTDDQGNYDFDVRDLGLAHAWCREMTAAALQDGHDVCVSNTFTTEGEIERYLNLPINAYKIVIIEMTGNYGSVHNVPFETLLKFQTRWVPNAKLAALPAYSQVQFKTV